ncbi:MAG: EpsG family protein [Chlorobium sp.]
MLPYWILFAIPAMLALRERPVKSISSEKWSQLWVLMFLLVMLMVGLRHQVGADWLTYIEHIRYKQNVTLYQALNWNEPGYNILNWIAAHYDFGIYFVNLVCGIFFAWGLVAFCIAQPRPWLAMVIAVPYLVIVVAMGYSRQGVAIGFGMFGLVALQNRKFIHFVFFLFLAILFHKSAVVLIPLAALANSKKKLWNGFWTVCLALVFYSTFIESSLSVYEHGYIENKYQSAGAFIRLLMNCVPALLFLLFRHRFEISKGNRSLFTLFSVVSLSLFLWLFVTSSSTVVDRLGLYLIPLQILILGRVPDAFGRVGDTNQLFVLSVVLYSAGVLFVWLFFAIHSAAWLPYQFYPFVWLSE